MSTFVANLLATGRVAFSSAEAQKELGLPRASLLKSARRLQKQSKLYSPRSSYYVIVPPQFLKWGAPPPSWFIDDLMRHEQRPYYVGLLKAAELHDASHQAVMEFQVVTSARLPKLQAGRSRIVFHYRRNLDELADAIEERKTDTGKMRLSSPELTALDLVRYPHAAVGFDNILTVITELGPKLDGGKLAILCPKFETSVRQRLGYLCARAGHSRAADVLQASLQNDRKFRWIEFDPSQAKGGPDLSPAPSKRDTRWRLVIRRAPEADEQ
ncbi:MAG TPA: type IV toxin-antitoxin system AbiEi family antitoxin [Candidatus Didemnitutus sp.]